MGSQDLQDTSTTLIDLYTPTPETPTPRLLLDHVELPHVLDLGVHLVHIIGWMGKGDHPKTFLPLALFY